MHRRIIIFSLCILPTIFHIEQTTGQGKTIILHETDKNVSIINATPSSVTLQWIMEQDFMDNLVKLTVLNRPRELAPSEHSFVYHNQTKYGSYYEAKYLDYNTSNYNSWNINTLWPGSGEVEEMLKKNLIRIDNLKYPDIEYDIDIHRTEKGNSTEKGNHMRKVLTKVRTLAAIPKASVGSFRVRAHPNNATRTVTIYWQWSKGMYVMNVYEETELIMWAEVGALETGFRQVNVSLKRNTILLKSMNTGPLQTFLVVSVPSQCDQVQVPPVSVFADKNDDSFLLIKWWKPEHLQVDNYTLFLISGNDGKEVRRILDLVHLDGNETSFRMKRTNLGLAMSVNTHLGSSGIRIIPLQ